VGENTKTVATKAAATGAKSALIVVFIKLCWFIIMLLFFLKQAANLSHYF